MSACMGTKSGLMNVSEWEADSVKNFYLACTIEENGKFYAYAVKAPQNSNLVSVLAGIANLKAANIYSTKKKAGEIVTFWNDCYRQNGTYLFDNPKF